MNALKTPALVFALLLGICLSHAQTTKTTTSKTSFRVQLDEYTVVKDSFNRRISYPDVLKLIASGSYTLDPIRDHKGNRTGEYRIRSKKTEDTGKREAELQTPGTENWLKPKIGDTIPAFTLTAVDGSVINSEKLKGKIVVINFWFSLCKPCLYEMPDINNLAASYKNNGDVVFLAPDWETRETVQRFMEIQPFAYIPLPEAHSLIDAMRISIYPTHLIIGRDGKILNSYSGGLPGMADFLKKDIDSALGLASH